MRGSPPQERKSGGSLAWFSFEKFCLSVCAPPFFWHGHYTGSITYLVYSGYICCAYILTVVVVFCITCAVPFGSRIRQLALTCVV